MLILSSLSELKLCIPEELSPPINTTLVQDAAGLEVVKDFLSRITVFGFDTETNFTDHFFDRRIRTIQVGDRNEQYVIDLLAFAGSEEDIINGQGNYTPAEWALPVIDTLRPALESNSHLKVGVRLEFEYVMTKWCLGLRPWHFYDCFLAEQVLFAGLIHARSTLYSMEAMVRRYAGLQISKDEQTTFNLSKPLTQSQIVYGGLDTRFPLAIMAGQRARTAQFGLERAIQIENNAIPGTADMHLNGLLVDSPMWLDIVGQTKKVHAGHVEALDNQFIPVVGRKELSAVDLVDLENQWRSNKEDKVARAAARQAFIAARRKVSEISKNFQTYEGLAAINYGASAQVKKALVAAGFKVKSTDDRILKNLSGSPMIDALRDYRESKKTLDSYGENFLLNHIHPVTGRVHTEFNQMGAATGRYSSENPNVQNIKKDSDWRSCFIARQGCKLITADYNGCELRILTEMSQEKVWIDAFNNGWDVHSVGAEIVFGEEWKSAAEPGCAYYESHQKCKCKKHKELREQIKVVNFSIIYGAEANKVADTLGIAVETAKVLLAKWRAACPTAWKYLCESGMYAVHNLMSRTLSGRIRFYKKPDWEVCKEKTVKRFKEDGKDVTKITSRDVSRTQKSLYGSIERQGKNSPIQGGNADMVKVALGCGFDQEGVSYLWQRLEPVYGAKLLSVVHDELVVEAKEHNAMEVKHFVEDCMARAGAEFVKSVRMVAEGVIDTKWNKG